LLVGDNFYVVADAADSVGDLIGEGRDGRLRASKIHDFYYWGIKV
jgi:hypothetical protein